MNSQHYVESYLQQNSIYQIYKAFLSTKFTDTLAKLDKNSDWNDVAKNIKKDDLSQIYEHLIPLAEEGKFHFAYGIAFIGYKIIQQLNDDGNLEELQMKYAIRLGWLCLKLRLSERAIDPLNNGLRISCSFPEFYKDRIEGLKLLANAYRNIGDCEKAISTYNNILELSQKNNDRNSEALILFMLGKLYCNYLNQIPRGIDYLFRASAIFKDIDNKLYYAICLDELGSANFDMSSIYENDQTNLNKHIEKVIDYHQQSLQLANEINYLPSKSRNLCHIGLAYMQLGNWDKAKNYLEKGITILESLLIEKRGLGIRYGQLGNLYIDQGNINEGISLIKKALKINREFNDIKNEVKNLINLSLSYKKLENYEESRRHLENAIELSKKYELLELEKEASYELGLIYSEIFENYEKAYTYFSRASELLEKILGNLIREGTEFKSFSPPQDIILMYQGLLEKYHMESIKNYKKNTEILTRAFYQLQLKRKGESELTTTVKIAMRTAHKMYSPLNRVMIHLEKLMDSHGQNLSYLNNLRKELLDMKITPSNNIKNISHEVEKIETWLKKDINEDIFIKENIDAVFDMVDQMKNQNPEKGFIPRLYLNGGVDVNYVLKILLEGDCKPYGFEVIFVLDEDLPVVAGNKFKLRQIFEPIIENISHHSKGNLIEVITKRMDKEYIQIEIRDNGVGINEMEIPKIFEPGYSKTDYPSSHQGLGLHIIKTLIDAYNAQITCKSKLGEGTTFSIIFPIKGGDTYGK